jgi:hypothetical protein
MSDVAASPRGSAVRFSASKHVFRLSVGGIYVGARLQGCALLDSEVSSRAPTLTLVDASTTGAAEHRTRQAHAKTAQEKVES